MKIKFVASFVKNKKNKDMVEKYKAEKYVTDLVSKRENLLTRCGSKENLKAFTDKELLVELLRRENFDEVLAEKLESDYWEFYNNLTSLLEKLEEKEEKINLSASRKHASH